MATKEEVKVISAKVIGVEEDFTHKGKKRERLYVESDEEDNKEGKKGGLLVFWSAHITVLDYVLKEFCIQLHCRWEGLSEPFWLIFVYANTESIIRSLQWMDLIKDKDQWGSFGGWEENSMI
ncbi:histone acetyltransferase of the CBP family 1 [Striga asiatica]|uniref:Histone acetyltransferase of the CBP family 1 n=1 Tax=Striga asiatica TaxID=4170 RepID=A0A5A7P8R7_STRAF|nr:histone acetyltransferase of the CBP family 1 [Striga asiatica]